MTNNRRHKRVPLASYAALTLRDDEEAGPVRGMTADISMSGIGFYLYGPLELDANVSLEIAFLGLGGLLRTDSIEGRPVYVNRLGEIYFVGIEFHEEIRPAKQPFLYERLQGVLSWY